MKDFLAVYLDYNPRKIEAPELFPSVTSVLAVVGHVLNRKVCLDQYYFKRHQTDHGGVGR